MSATKVEIRKPFETRKRFAAPAGNEIEPVYEYVIDSKGRKVLEQTGTKNTREEIQADLEATKIENILARVAVGDYTDFRPDGIYTDVSKMPNNLIDAMQAMQNLENTWNKVPNDIKSKYHFDLNEFIAASGSKAWCEDMGLINITADEITPTAEALKPETKPEIPTESN